MKRKEYRLPVVLAICSALIIFVVGVWLRQMALDYINEERKQQLGELTQQISDRFSDALESNLDSVGIAATLFSQETYDSEQAIAQQAARLQELIWTGQEDADSIFFLLDSSGVCYDSNGRGAIWGDFDQVAGMGESAVFIADSVNYEGTHWAFVRMLDKPVTTDDGITICYAVLLKPVSAMNSYYTSNAYSDVCEIYILRENGTRMYGSASEEDAIPSNNIYKQLRESDNRYDEDFDEVLEELSESGVACGNYAYDGTEYCYSLARQSEYSFVLLFLIPTESVAVNTMAMVSAMMSAFLFVGAIMLCMVMLFAITLGRLTGSRRIAELKEKNLEEIKKANEKLAQANESLLNANRVAKSALDIAKSANRAKSTFLSNMSHDIRTPLNAIIGFLTLLESSADDPKLVRHYTDKIRVSSQHLLNLINDILDMSRIESGKVTLNAQDFSVGGLLEETRSVMEQQAHAKDLQLTVEAVDTQALVVRGDKLRLSQILMNLLSNAVKYTPQGGKILLKVELCGKPTPSVVQLRFSVKDNGIGMSEDFQKRVFEPFEREQTSTTSGIQGTGLGMAITKNLVDLMGGIIFVDSVQGKGSTFTLELPFQLVEDSAEAAAALPNADKIAAEEKNATVLNGRHFLVAEDNEINAEIIQELLKAEGATCDIAKNGKEALAIFEKSKPGMYDAIFMDIQMPVMDGYEAASHIRSCAHPDAARIPIAAMTANAFAEDVQKALQSGMNTHIPKPVDMKKVREFIACEIEKHNIE